MAVVSGPLQSDYYRFWAEGGRVFIGQQGGPSRDITDALIHNVEMHQAQVDVTSISDPYRTMVPTGETEVVLRFTLYDHDIKETRVPHDHQPSQEPQEASREKKRLQLPPEGQRPGERKLGRPGGTS